MLWVVRVRERRVSPVVWALAANVPVYKQEVTLSFPKLSTWILMQGYICIHEHLAWVSWNVLFQRLKNTVEYSCLFKNYNSRQYESFRLYFIPACPWSGSTTKKVVSGRCVSWFEVTLVVQQKRCCHAKGGGYCQHHQLSNHMGQAAPGSKGVTTDDNMSQCNLLTSESLGPDTCAFLLWDGFLKQQSADVISVSATQVT